MREIIQLSDIHFPKVKPELVEAVSQQVLKINPNVLIISGDLTQRARKREFRQAQAFIQQFNLPKIIVPGNHDVSFFDLFHRFYKPLTRYKNYISPEISPFFMDEELAVLGINTARSLALKNGRVSYRQMDLIRQYMLNLPTHYFKILVTHHPFIPPEGKPNIALVGRAEQTLRSIEDCNIDLLLSGHFHRSYSYNTSQIYKSLKKSIMVFQAGTATSTRVRYAPNSFNYFKINNRILSVKVYIWTGKEFTIGYEDQFKQNTDGVW